jgi:hypothetical protein
MQVSPGHGRPCAERRHGLFIEVLPDNRFLAWWFTFNPAGTEQATFGGVGTYSGNVATITEVYQTTGGRFIPNFDPTKIVNNLWGALSFTFSDRDHGRVDFDSIRGYGRGSMNLTRLTQPIAMGRAVGPGKATGRWVQTGSLNVPRRGHTATLLANGNVLVAGGSDYHRRRAELYDPATGVWSYTGAMNVTRERHSATLLPNGKVFVSGGSPSWGVAQAAELYDPDTGTWSLASPAAVRRSYPTVTLLQDGKVLVAGGVSDEGSGDPGAEVYDPLTDRWTRTGGLKTPRSGHSAMLLRDGRVLVTGGWWDGTSATDGHWPGQRLSSAEIFDPITGMWTPVEDSRHIHEGHTATRLSDGKVLIAGTGDFV